MTYKTCPKCGSNLDAGERCDCEDVELTCEGCSHCLPIGEGDHICDKNEFRLSFCRNIFRLKIIYVVEERIDKNGKTDYDC